MNICMHTRGSKCECVQGQEHMRYMKCCIEMLIYLGSNCGDFVVLLEVLTVRVRTRLDL